MRPDSPPPVWAGRSLALLGIALVALSLREGVAVISPIVEQIDQDLNLTPIVLGVIGMVAPVAFAVFGLLTPMIAHRLGLERTLLIALAAAGAGHLIRGSADTVTVFLLASALTLGGAGMGNVLLPPLVKKCFPDRIGPLTALTTALFSIGTAAPALLAAPVAERAGWRFAVAILAAVVIAAMVPWILLLLQRRRTQRALDEPPLEEARPEVVRRLWSSKVAWAIALTFGVSSLNAYAIFIWLPEILRDVAGIEATGAGALLSLYSIAGLPTGLVVSVLAARMRNVGILIYLGVAFLMVGTLGLLLLPTVLTWLWVLLAGLGPLLFPVALVLVNLRSRTHGGVVALSGFVQGVGYTLGSVGPLVVGLLHELSGGWTLPLIFLTAISAAGIIAGLILTKPTMLEDDLARRAG